MEKLFDMPATHEPLKMPRVRVELEARVVVDVPVDVAQLLRAAGQAERAELPPEYLHDADQLKHALGCLAWEMAALGHTDEINVECVSRIKLDKVWPLVRIAAELQQPTFVPIGGGS